MMRFKLIKVLMLCILAFCPAAAATESSHIMKIAGTASNTTIITEGLVRERHPKSVVDSGMTFTSADVKTNSSEDLIESFIPYDLGLVENAVAKLNRSRCWEDSMMVLGAISQREKWALQMFDASSKFPVGLLSGAFYQLGNFDECVAAKQPNPNLIHPAIQGQYCLIDVELKPPDDSARGVRFAQRTKNRARVAFNDTIHWAVCLPSSCTKNEVAVFFKEIFVEYNGIEVGITHSKCHINESQPFTTLEIIYGFTVGLFVLLIVFATIFHYHHIQVRKRTLVYTLESVRSAQPGTLRQLIFCFSVIQSVSKFLKTRPSDLNLECICGIKFLSMSFIIGGHTLLHLVGGPVLNTNFHLEESENLINSIFLNGPLLVDTFLLISGFLVTYLLIIEYDKTKGRVNILSLIAARYIRLTPSYFLVIGLYCTFLYRMGSGPLWDFRMVMERERCLKSWWTNVLYINNYVNTQYLCMFQSWYLAVDYHLFIVALLVVYGLWHWRRLGKAILGVLIFVSLLVPFWITFSQQLDATLLPFAPEIYDLARNFYFSTVYIKTHIRSTSYLVGVLFGYLVYKLKASGTKIPSYVLWSGWFFSSVCGLLSLVSIVVFVSPDHEYDALESAIYACLHRASWSLAIGWVLVACVTDNATLVNKFLSWKFFVPLSRLTYCAYLVNGIVELYSLGTIRTNTNMSKFDCGSKMVAHLVFTFSLAFVLCILFESPILGMEKILLRKDKKKRNANEENADES